MRLRSRVAASVCLGASAFLVSACTWNIQGGDGSNTRVDCPGIPTTVTAVATGTCTWTASPSPSIAAQTPTTLPSVPSSSASASSSVVPTSASTSSSVVPASGFPTPATTGFPVGTVFTTLNATTVTADRTVLDRVHIKGDLTIAAHNVTVTNSWIEGSINDDDHQASDFAVSDTTVGPTSGCVGLPGLWSANFTAIRVKVQNHDNGFQLAAGNAYATVRDSFVSTCGLTPAQAGGDGSHSDGFQAYCPVECGTALLDHDTFMINTKYHTSAVFSGLGGPLVTGNGWPKSFTLTNSLLVGGVYPIYVGLNSGTSVTVKNNVINSTPYLFPDRETNPSAQDYAYDNTPRPWDYGPTTSDGTCAGQVWSGNTIADVNLNTFSVTGTPKPVNCTN